MKQIDINKIYSFWAEKGFENKVIVTNELKYKIIFSYQCYMTHEMIIKFPQYLNEFKSRFNLMDFVEEIFEQEEFKSKYFLQ